MTVVRRDAGAVAAVEAEALAARRALVDAERDRRLRSSFAFMVRGEVYRFQSDATSLQRITGAATLAGFARAQGAGPGNYLWHGGTQPFAWIAEDNRTVALDAVEMFALGQAAAAHEQGHVFAARAIKSLPEGVPEDFAADRWWPG